MTTAAPPAFLAEVREIVGDQHVLIDPDVVAGYCVDWSGRFVGDTPAVARVGSTAEVAAVVAACRRHGIAVVPQGGNTGLVGGSVPLDGEVVLSLRRLRDPCNIDESAGQIVAGAGVAIADVHDAAAASGWSYPVDFGARDTATVGGSVATNAGGLHVMRYGGTREQLVGVEAVLGDGSVVSHLGGLLKDNTGYDLAGLLCGSEGTLGVVTVTRLRLVPPLVHRVTALLSFATVGDAVAAVVPLRRSLPTLEACELMLDSGLELVCRTAQLPAPFPEHAAAYLLVECAAETDPTPELAEAVASLSRVVDVAVGETTSRRAALWAYREGHTEAVNLVGPPHKLDVTLPAHALAEFVDRVAAVIATVAPDADTWLFGHAADGNIHVNVTGVAPDDERVDDGVLQLVAALGGSISAEHGIGTAKKRWLHLCRDAAEVEAFRAIKGALDPDGILNPNVLLP